MKKSKLFLKKLISLINNLSLENYHVVNFVLLIDPNINRRTEFIKKIMPLIPPVKGLTVFTASNGDLTSIWASGSWTPVSHLNDNKGITTIWGDAINQTRYDKITADQLRKLWNTSSNAIPIAFDGFYAAFTYNQTQGLVVGTDLLGFFPIYYYATDEILLVGSSPELFRYHKCFKKEFNPIGLVGIFLTNGLVNGQTLLKDVKRLNAGHILTWMLGKKPEEKIQYSFPVSTKYFELPFSKQINILDQALERAFFRHISKDSKYCLMLSGGLDSRLIGGYLKKRGANTVALTDGLPTDLEMKCATKVAAKLGFKHYITNVDSKKYWSSARLRIKWEHLGNGFSGVIRWEFYPYLRKCAPKIVVGYAAEIILGCHVNYNPFEKAFEKMNKWGFSENTLNELLNPKVFGNSVSDTIKHLRDVYDKNSKLEFQKTYAFWLNHRARFHVGSTLWALSFGAWPVLPFLDSQVLAVISAMPFNSLAYRKIENELIITKFPELARLPLDRNFYDTTPLIPTKWQKMEQYINNKANFWTHGLMSKIKHKLRKMEKDRLYYYRMYNFNNSGWKTIRQRVDVDQSIARYLFNEINLRKILPSQNENVKVVDEIIDSANLKNMIGFLLWLKHISLD
ncbi:MAG: hypothetical protein IAX21_11505 [Candidatus Bathyarchaeota archaeon]|nr:MAG: hypothetical protein IAX21_11505 [Candidatus Bathyarchaeota archaeon]